MRIGSVELNGFAAMAPMAGAADLAVRTLARQFGACLTTGEMTSAKGVSMGSAKSLALLDLPDEHPYAVQLFGTDPVCLRAAARIAAERGADLVDFNMGCPAPKIVKGGAGSALLKNLPLAKELVAAAVEGAGDVPVTVKIRRGFDAGEDVAVEAALAAQEAGASAVCVHARTRAQMYAPPVDLGCIARVKRAVRIPVIGNGDILTAADAVRMFAETGCDLVAVGRGALGNPWLFGQINAVMRGLALPDPPALEERLAVLLREIALLVADKGEGTGFREARKHVAWYLTGLRGAASLRRMCGAISRWEDVEAICREARRLNT